ncbi:site-specific integrase [Psychromonas sp. Urea-02u-13]|uniref:site-specific integrase n=1 Tax=Psychromonas sp. Urea-02u-13 TaxID=2058326 RepID=UPI000C32D108|nr:site-specific integrase [Psychromonas sp. Urea-02u-13]PKG40675.1 site-specific integrase [Psychromonas sp. Urea-02u-13]
MGSINQRNGKLVADFRYMNQRCREQTQLNDTSVNRKRLMRLLKTIEAEILLGNFQYAKYFPNSNKVQKFEELNQRKQTASHHFSSADSPTVKEFSEIWFREKAIEWRKSHKQSIEGILDSHILPAFGKMKISAIKKQDILTFRAALAKVQTRTKKTLSASRINHIMTPLRMLLNEAADRYEFTTPWKNIKALKVPRTEVNPFSLDEVERLIKTAPEGFKPYYIVRFFTGLRTGEIDGLHWDKVDLDKKQIYIDQSLVKGEMTDAKTDGSNRVIKLTDRVVSALKVQMQVTKSKSEFVFCKADGKQFNYQTISRVIWEPMLQRLNLKYRNPYQTRHTFATLLLAAGESPEWIAQQMGHSTTTMLFRVYSRYVPNLTRQDGSAFDRYIETQGEENA